MYELVLLISAPSLQVDGVWSKNDKVVLPNFKLTIVTENPNMCLKSSNSHHSNLQSGADSHFRSIHEEINHVVSCSTVDSIVCALQLSRRDQFTVSLMCTRF